MRLLTSADIDQVAGGELTCTFDGEPCTPSINGMADGFASLYEMAVAATTDAMEWLANWLRG